MTRLQVFKAITGVATIISFVTMLGIVGSVDVGRLGLWELVLYGGASCLCFVIGSALLYLIDYIELH